jgi:rare lipoprotein A
MSICKRCTLWSAKYEHLVLQRRSPDLSVRNRCSQRRLIARAAGHTPHPDLEHNKHRLRLNQGRRFHILINFCPQKFPVGPKHKRRGRQMLLRSGSLALSAVGVIMCLSLSNAAKAEVASVYGGSDGLCGSRTANGEHMNCSAMTAAHRTLPFGTRITVCHHGCVVVRINDRGPFVPGRHIDLTPAAAHAIGLSQTGQVSLSH